MRHAPSPPITFATVSKWFFIGCFIHGIRVWRLMIHMEREQISTFSGPPLPFFRWFPKATYWSIRLAWEPLFVFVLATVLGNLGVLQNIAVAFLQFSAVCLAMKNAVSWHSSWEYLRRLMDAKNMGPIVAKMLENTATENEVASVNLAAFPKSAPPEMKRSFIAHIARAVQPKDKEEEKNNG